MEMLYLVLVGLLLTASCQAQDEETPLTPTNAACHAACTNFCNVFWVGCVNIPPWTKCPHLYESCNFMCEATCDCIDSCGPSCQENNGDCTKVSPIQLPGCLYRNTLCNVGCRLDCPGNAVLANYKNFFKFVVDIVPDVFPGIGEYVQGLAAPAP